LQRSEFLGRLLALLDFALLTQQPFGFLAIAFDLRDPLALFTFLALLAGDLLSCRLGILAALILQSSKLGRFLFSTLLIQSGRVLLGAPPLVFQAGDFLARGSLALRKFPLVGLALYTQRFVLALPLRAFKRIETILRVDRARRIRILTNELTDLGDVGRI